MSVASHLNIRLDEYDAMIRTFVPRYEQMLTLVADLLKLLEARAPIIVDLGVGTGALAERCVQVRPDAHLFGIDADAAILEAARARLASHPRLDLIHGSFLDTPLPPCDAIVACIALHHVVRPADKQALYAACARALNPGGMLISADYCPARDPRLAALHRSAWAAHLERMYSPEETEAFFAAWARDDVYFPLEAELDWLRAAGLLPEVVWRQDGYAVVAAARV